jgi:GWxTD domain-containing protein
MSSRHVKAFVLASALVLPTAVAALDKDEKAWLDEVKPIMLPSEEKIFSSLKSKEDRAEFQKIFWARRDPDLMTPENEAQKKIQDRQAAAKKRYAVKADRSNGILLPLEGDETDCGVVYIVLGEPAAHETIPGPKHTREPQKWTYSTVKTPDGADLTISFDGNCKAVGNEKFVQNLKESLVVQSDVSYHVEKDKLTKKLEEMVPKPGPAQALLLQPRQDFPLATEASFVKIQEGGTGVFGLVKGDAAGLTLQDAGAQKIAKVLIRAEAKGEDGSMNVAQREVAAPVVDGSFVASYRLGVRPGNYSVKVGVVDPVSSKGSVVTEPLTVPNFNKGELTISSLFALEDIQDASPDPTHPFAAFEIGTTRLIPRFGNVFKPQDSLQISYQYYDPKVDEATHKSSTVAQLSILKPSGSPAAEAPPQEFDTAVAGSAIGPVPLAKYAPGKYRIVLKVTDKVAQKDYTQEASFEVKPAK